MMKRIDYRGICASSYDLLIPGKDIADFEFYRTFIEANGEPALEIGCGTGRLLLDYVSAGLDVEGVDVSPAMLDICRGKAEESGLLVTLHEQQMQWLNLPRRYRTLYVPVSSFMLVTDLDQAASALNRFLAHLEPGGKVVIPLHLPWKEDIAVGVARPGEWRLRREGIRPEDGAVIRCWELATDDFEKQLRHAQLRYEVLGDEPISCTEEHYSISLRWYNQEQFSGLLREAGFTAISVVRGYTAQPVTPEDASFTVIGTR